MGAELPLVSAAIARMPSPELNLAAYGSLVFPLALAIEAPIIMLLAASTALCVDWPSYVKVRRFMVVASALLTALHIAIAFTPAFDAIAREWIGAPPETIEAGRIGFRILTPWTWSIAYRRFQQGVLIRCERSRWIGVGTLVRLAANALVLGIGFAHGGASGIVVGASAVAAGVVGEAAFIGICVQRVLRERIRSAPPAAQVLTRASFLTFYAPLALTPLVTLIAQPIGAAAMARMSDPLASLATWPAFHGLVFLTRSFGLAFNEVVVALIAAPGGIRALRDFATKLALATASLLALVALTPLAELWFRGWSHLDVQLAELGALALHFAVVLPALNAAQSYFQGALVHTRRTRAVTESTVVSLATTCIGLAVCVQQTRWPGLVCTAAMMSLGNLFQTIWLYGRARGVLAALARDDAARAAKAP